MSSVDYNKGLDSILQQLNMADFFLNQGLTVVKKTAKTWTCSCPFCGDDKHFNLDPKTGLWNCWKCKETGNVISFYAKLHNCNNGEAVKAIKEFIGMDDDDNRKGPNSPSRSRNKKGKGNALACPKSPHSGDKSGKTDVSEQKQTLPPGPSQAVYQRFVELAVLTDAHRAELKKNRGFTDEIIDRFMFRSGGDHIRTIADELQQEFNVEVLERAGILVNVNGGYVVNDQLTDNRVLIPYLDEQSKVYHLRPHKLGFKDIPAQVYCRGVLRRKPEHVVLTEGEFKAVALWQWGIPAIAVPGTPTFVGKNFERLVQFLQEFDVKRVTVIFDNEDKSDPKLPGFKQKVENRYDVLVLAYINAWKLNKTGIPTNIGILPDEWRDRGKVDFDMALAQGRTREDILRVIRSAVPPKEFLSGLDKDAKKIVQRKINRHFQKERLPIKREYNKYVVTRRKGEDVYEEAITNFVIDIKASFYTADGVVRNVEFVNEYGEKSELIPLLPADMAGMNEFKKFCFSKGNYIFKGKGDDLTKIWELELMRDSGEFIYQPDRIGNIKGNLWLFGNLAVKDGQVYYPDNDGIIWIDGKGYKPSSLTMGPKGESMENAIPALSEEKFDLKQLAERIKHNIGSYDAYAAIGWAIATVFSEDIFKKYKAFPILYVHGKKEGGKSTLVRWIIRMLGIESDGYSINESSQNFIARALSYHSSLPIWFDEYRNENEVTRKNGYFRSAFNRQFSGKGTTSAYQARGFNVHGTLVLSGQETPRDAALFSRLVAIQVSEYKRDRMHYDWLNANAHRFSYLTYYLILNYNKYKDNLLADIAEWKETLIKLDINDRTAENWAIVASAFGVVLFEDPGFMKWVAKTCKEMKYSGEQEQELNQFWDSLNTMQSIGEIGNKHLKVETGVLYIWFNGIYDLWAMWYRKKTGREPFDKNSIIRYLKGEPYFIRDDRTRFNGDLRRCYAIDVESGPEAAKEIAAAIENNSTPTFSYLDERG